MSFESQEPQSHKPSVDESNAGPDAYSMQGSAVPGGTGPNYVGPGYAGPTYAGPTYPGPSYPPPTPNTGFATVAVQPKKSRAWIVALIAVVLAFIVMMFGIVSCSNIFSNPLSSSSSASAADSLASDAIAIIPINDTIQYDGTTSSPDGLKQQLDTAANNSHIKAVVLRVNSGGGVATAGEEMTTYVRQFKEKTGKPVVVSSAATNACTAYEISSQADYIYVAQTTSIGAIGTAMQLMDYSKLLEMLGINIEDITSSTSKDSTYGNRALTDEERAYYQHQIDQINEIFVQNVADGRNMSVDEVRKLATGLTFTGMDAVSNGLADEVGTEEDAIEKAAELSGTAKGYTTITLTKDSDDLSSLLGLMSEDKSMTKDELISALKELEDNGALAK